MAYNFDNNIPIYIQLVEVLKKDIISGKMNPKDRLPSVRDLALEFKVNPNTMQRALVELENLKLVYTESTNGRFITHDKKLINKYKENYAQDLTKTYLTNMKEFGFNKCEVINYLERIDK